MTANTPTITRHSTFSTAARLWSDFGDQYNDPSGVAYTMPIIRPALKTYLFPLFDELRRASGNREPLQVLVLACGSGPEVDVLVDGYGDEQMKILATDFAEGMVKTTQKMVHSKGKSSMVETKVLDATNMDLPDSSFDVILLFLGPMLLPDPPRGLAEIRRVLRPGGLSAFLTPQDFHQYDIIDEAKHLIVQARPSNLSEEERWRGIPFKRFRDSPMMRTWGQLSFVQDKVAKAGFTRVKGTVVNGMSVIQPNEVATFLSSLLHNPGMQFIKASFSEEECKAFEYHLGNIIIEKWPPPQAPQLRCGGNLVWGYEPVDQ
ncbi:S-adenosyl-L-methionine-dependent methyltransferase [Acaromyces ingoldii]|uniref:S-adenosyl-L-methionine-dependent methyltransferase n=1 Tax=Acaromyces ingoldii TaxID=215250 RepID=A0A316YSI3_9BASI|nr:S-adenosyl-L-methionine-dependent methyltransferase [Acaromyces ingoldii]PWN92269.1 S-adenosyl-L-methionine-dependent methyltransferase [Acaromyces ingoldii]